MVKCPRCKFEQPEDVFCASCGVNMQNYRAKHSRPWALITIATLALVLAIGFGIKKFSSVLDRATQKTDLLEEALNEPTPAPSVAPSTGEVPPSLRRDSPRNTMFATSARPTPTTPTADEAAQPAAAVAPAPSPSASPTAPAKVSNQMTVEFALVPKDSMSKLTLAVGQPSSNLLLKTKFDEVSRDTGFQNLSSESHTLTVGQAASINQGSPEPKTKEYIGFIMKITLARAGENAGDYKIQIKRNLPMITGVDDIKISSEDFSESVSIAPGQVFAISGLLPRKPIVDNEIPLYTSNILRALLEPGFQKFDQEFVVFFTP